MNEPQQPDTLGRWSLGLGIASAALVFGIGMCALTLRGTAMLQTLGIPLFVCGASSAFLGIIGAVVGVGSLFSQRAAGPVAIVGLLLGGLGACMFVFLLQAVGG